MCNAVFVTFEQIRNSVRGINSCGLLRDYFLTCYCSTLQHTYYDFDRTIITDLKLNAVKANGMSRNVMEEG